MVTEDSCINHLLFADDAALIATNKKELQKMLNRLEMESARFGLTINVAKTKVMEFGGDGMDLEVKVRGQKVETVKEFTFLGALITNKNDCSVEIKRRIQLANGAMSNLAVAWKSMGISRKTKLKLIDVLIMSILRYGSECWTMKESDIRRLEAFHHKALRRALGIMWFELVSNKEVRKRAEIKLNDLVPWKVKQRKVSFFGHIARMGDESILRNVMLSELRWKRRKRGARAISWMDDVSDWTKMDLEELLITASEKKEFRAMVRGEISMEV
jgi:hypothetical protein